MRLFLSISAALALAACSSSPANDSSDATTPAAAATTTPPMLAESCKADAAQQFVGKTATPEIVEQARVATGAKTARVLTPGMMVTMEYRGDRLNVRVGTDNVIGSVDCG
ncbi:I78 family peptidase inhibitor [Noviluteimonas dokdonensis]|nr:I78 family peptidase inhibitor [Lysobacter dokdonensis]